MSVHLCLQHVYHDAARRSGSPATADTCERCQRRPVEQQLKAAVVVVVRDYVEPDSAMFQTGHLTLGSGLHLLAVIRQQISDTRSLSHTFL